MIKCRKMTYFSVFITYIRFCSNKPVRVRFAPSPTGFLHLGGLRTALYNFLYARSKGGTFILRIEDTDQTRLVKGAIEKLQEDLEWAGIVPDEGPFSGGPFGPYLQSERLHLYRWASDKLVENDVAYYCFCSTHRLDLMRKEALRRRQVPRYDNRCRNITKEEAQKKIDAGIEHCVRLKLTEGNETFHDLVYGEITHDVVSIEGDPVIFKSDGFPTYHLASVVDDHQMKVTHVLRGVEWQASTPKHLMLYKGFGWEPPQYAHLPLLLNTDGSKLSKRQGDITVDYYRTSHVLPRALVNFITFSGGGFHWDNYSSSTSARCLDMDQLSSQFDLSLVRAASCRASYDRLEEFNQCELIRQMANEAEMAELVSQLQSLLIKTYTDRINSCDLNEKYIRSVLVWSQKRISRLNQLIESKFSYLWVKPPTTYLDERQADIIKQVYESLCLAQEFKRTSLSDLLQKFAIESNVKVKELMQLLRLLLCGQKVGPAVVEVLEVLGKRTSLARIETALESRKQH